MRGEETRQLSGATDEVARALGDLQRAAQHCAQLTRGLLAFSRRTPASPRVLDVSAVVDEVEELRRPLVPSRVEFEIVDRHAGARIVADPVQLQQVVVNLVVNARDAMPDGGRLELGVSRREIERADAARLGIAPGPYVELAVSDTGIGIEPRVRSRIFEPFFTTKEPGKGTGLGLATCYGIVQECRGAIDVHSEPGRGATFRVLLPESRSLAETSEAPVPGEGLRGPGAVLVVEDEAAVRRALARALREGGYEVVEAGDGAEAIEIAGARRFDALVTDVDMPRVGGIDLALRLASERAPLPVLFVSGTSGARLARANGPVAAGLATVQLSTPAPNGITEVKFFIFFAIALFGIPGMTCAALTSAKLRGWLLALLIFSTALGDLANINFVSMENYRGPDRGFEVNLTDLITLSLAFALIIKHFKQIKWFPTASAWMAALFVISSISVWQAADPLLGCFTLVKQVKSYVLFWTVVNVVRIGTDKKYIWWGLAGIGMFFSTLVLKQKYLVGIYRISGSFDHSNTVPLFLNLIIPLLLIWGLTDRTLPKWKTFVSIVGALGMVFAVVSTFSRAGTALSVLCLIAALVTANLRARSRRVSAVSLLMVLALLIGGFKAANSFRERIKNAPESSEAARVEFNIAAARMAKERWLGVGLNNFSLFFSLIIDDDDILTRRDIVVRVEIDQGLFDTELADEDIGPRASREPAAHTPSISQRGSDQQKAQGFPQKKSQPDFSLLSARKAPYKAPRKVCCC